MFFLTKTDFMLYLQCPKSLWLKKHKPQAYQRYKKPGHFSGDGHEVERYAEQLFSGDTPVSFQYPQRTIDGLYACVDVLEQNHDGTYNLYEVKSSKKTDNHIKDPCFQMITLENSGLVVRDVFIIHVNGNYVRDEIIDPHQLLQKVCVTREVRNCEEETHTEINGALALLHNTAIDESRCECYWKTRSHHCHTFAYFNRIPQENSVWALQRISERKLRTLLGRGIERLVNIPPDIALTPKQSDQVSSAVRGRPIVQRERIVEMLNTLTFPLYFLDYETANSGVPKIPGIKPWQRIPFQFSLHILHQNGRLEHKEHLCDAHTARDVKFLLRALCNSVGPVGSVIVWQASFEKSLNCEMGQFFPEYCARLNNINRRIFDLQDIFKEAYIDARFGGSTSIKAVWSVMCPNPSLSYENLEVQEGTQAMKKWFAMLNKTDNERLAIRNALLKYCKLDTLAMVKLYRKVRRQLRSNN